MSQCHWCPAPSTILLECLHPFCDQCLKDFREDHTTCCGIEISVIDETETDETDLGFLDSLESQIDQELKKLEKVELDKKIVAVREAFEERVEATRRIMEEKLQALARKVPSQKKEIEIREDDLKVLKDRIDRVRKVGFCSPANLKSIREVIDHEIPLIDLVVPVPLVLCPVEDFIVCRFPRDLDEANQEFFGGYQLHQFEDYFLVKTESQLTIYDSHMKEVEEIGRFRILTILKDRVLIANDARGSKYNLLQFKNGKLQKLRSFERRQPSRIQKLYPDGYVDDGNFYTYDGVIVNSWNQEAYQQLEFTWSQDKYQFEIVKKTVDRGNLTIFLEIQHSQKLLRRYKLDQTVDWYLTEYNNLYSIDDQCEITFYQLWN